MVVALAASMAAAVEAAATAGIANCGSVGAVEKWVL
jgi:hypothetical protein